MRQVSRTLLASDVLFCPQFSAASLLSLLDYGASIGCKIWTRHPFETSVFLGSAPENWILRFLQLFSDKVQKTDRSYLWHRNIFLTVERRCVDWLYHLTPAPTKNVKISLISQSAKIRLTALKYVLRWDFKAKVLCGLLINSTILLSSHCSSNIIDDAPTSNLWSETCEILSRLCSFATNISRWGDYIHDLMSVRRSWCCYYDGGSNNKLNLLKKNVKIWAFRKALKYV